MSKKYSNDVVLIKRRNKFARGIAIFLLIVLIANIIFWSGVGISYLLSKNGFSWFRSTTIKVDSLNYYAIVFGEYNSENESLECSIWTASSGGAAYVYQDSTFAVVGMLYENIDDANTVINNFSKDLTYMPKIQQFKSKKFSFAIDDIIPSHKKAVEDYVASIMQSVNKMLNISNKIDTNVLSNVSASSEINLMKSEIKIAKSTIDSINSNYENTYLKNLSNYLIKAEDSLDVCINKLLTSENYSGVCKYCACELFFNFYDLSKILSNN